MHYFEEDSIVEKLYTLDGEEYKPAKPTYTPTPTPQIKPVPKTQFSFFDMLEEKAEEVKEKTSEEIKCESLSVEDSKDFKGLTIYQRYNKVQNNYPESIVVFRLGDFYEVFGNNAIIIANELDLTLTGRDCGLEERVSMVGFPYHIADKYISKLVENGHKVAVVEDLNNITIKEKENTKKHWINENTYADNDGVIHEEISKSNSSMDSAVISIWKNLLGEDLII